MSETELLQICLDIIAMHTEIGVLAMVSALRCMTEREAAAVYEVSGKVRAALDVAATLPAITINGCAAKAGVLALIPHDSLASSLYADIQDVSRKLISGIFLPINYMGKVNA